MTDFGSLFKTEEVLTKSLTFQNIGTTELKNCLAPSLISGDTSLFTISADSCGSFDLNKGESCNFDVTAAPVGVGTFSAMIGRSCNGTMAVTTVQVTGVGLTVTAFSPESGASSIDPHSNLFATFSHALSTFTVSGSNISLLDTGTGINFPADLSYNSSSKIVTIDPKIPLPSSRSITITMGTGFKTALGTSLESSTSNVFTTGDAQVIAHGYATTYNTPSLKGACSTTSTNLTATLNGAAAGVNITYNDVDCSDGNFEITPNLAIAGNGAQTISISVDSSSTSSTATTSLTMTKCASFAAIGAFGAFDGGDGSVGDPYLISTREQLNQVKNDVTKAFKMTADVDLSCYSFDPIGTNGGRFSGVFDGAEYAVNGLSFENNSTSTIGLFGYIDDATIKNLDLTNVFTEQVGTQPYTSGLIGRHFNVGGPVVVTNILVTGRLISDSTSVGLLVSAGSGSGHSYSNLWVSGHSSSTANPGSTGLVSGAMANSSFDNVYIQGAMEANRNSAGIAGYSGGGLVIKNAFCDTNIDGGEDKAGACLGYAQNPTLYNVYSKGVVIGSNYVGGIIGLANTQPFFHNVSSDSNVTVNTGNGGGIAGHVDVIGIVSHSKATGNVTNTGLWDRSGGIAGKISNVAMVLNTKSTGNVSGGDNWNGGIAGIFLNGVFAINTYATGSITSNDLNGGILGRIGDAKSYLLNSHYYGSSSLVSTLNRGGGLMGINDGTIENSYFLSGLCELGNGCDDTVGGVEYSAAQMAVQSNYTNWDFSSGRNWVFKTGATYPTLSFEDCSSYSSITAATSFAGGDGSGGDPFQIATLSQLAYAATLPTSNFILTANIDASGSCYSWTPFGTNGTPFTGVFDGNSKSIQGLYIANESVDSGFFGSINGATVNNLTLYNFVTGINNERAGSLAGDANNSTITSVINYGHIVNGANDTAGLVALAQNGTVITSSTNYGYVGSNSDRVGGLVGHCNNCTITKSTNAGGVIGNDDVGGIVGMSSAGATLTDVNNLGNVHGDTSVAGLVGNLSAAADTVTNGLSVGVVYGRTSSASFVADKDAGATITDSFFLDTACGVAPPVGCPEASTAIGLTQADLILLASYPGGWNFTTIWEINNGVSYPSLR
ncbi:MAG: hypothetical protein HOE90_04990 [Bacteriovoracaceae bacterium]|jgi:hypothetical protein|nr:hypothetical protein [Bacteriovoracaceae bacterium]